MQRTQHISDDKYAIYILENMVFVCVYTSISIN